MASGRHSTIGRAFSVNHGLHFCHSIVVRYRRSWVIQRLLNFCAEPCVVSVGVSREPSGKATFGGNAGEENTNGIGQGQADAFQCGGGAGFEGVVHPDVEHG